MQPNVVLHRTALRAAAEYHVGPQSTVNREQTMNIDAFLNHPAATHAYHTTHRDNLHRIRAKRRLESAERLHQQSATPNTLVLGQRRTSAVVLQVGSHVVRVCDQSPLHAGNIAFDPGWNLDRLCQRLNQLVFFWPGTSAVPSDYGLRHAKRYSQVPLAFLRLPMAALFAANQPRAPLFCRFNSGAPRCVGGARSPRGASTFQVATSFTATPRKVVEVVFEDEAVLPEGTEWSDTLEGGWQPL